MRIKGAQVTLLAHLIIIAATVIIATVLQRTPIQILLPPQLQRRVNVRSVWVKAIPPVPIVMEAASDKMLRLDSAGGSLEETLESMTTVVSPREYVLRAVALELKHVPDAVVSER